MDVMPEIQKHNSVLIMENAQSYQVMRDKLYRTLQNVPTISVGLILPYTRVIRHLDEAGIRSDKLFYIDCVSSAAFGTDIERAERALFVHEASDLTGIAMAIDAFLAEMPQERYIVITALPVLHYYNSETTVLHFIRFLIERAKCAGTHVVVLSPGRQDESFVRHCRKLFEKVIEVDGHV